MRKAFTFVAITAWFVTMISWFPLAQIEREALSQPEHSTAQYVRPMKLKGVIRYVTSDQEWWDNLAYIGFTGGWITGAGAFIALKWLEKRSAASSPK